MSNNSQSDANAQGGQQDTNRAKPQGSYQQGVYQGTEGASQQASRGVTNQQSPSQQDEQRLRCDEEHGVRMAAEDEQ